jgi:phage gp29-like protein
VADPIRQAQGEAAIKVLPQQSVATPERVLFSIRARFNPIRNLTPDLLSRYLDNFRQGFFREITITWDAMERRDTRLQTVAPKRKKAVARRGWEILVTQDTPEAQRQKKALEYFFNNVTATSALEPNEEGGLSLLVRQMMDAVGKRYAVHEIVWQPSPKGLTAQFVFCPLWWFEGTTGRLRFLQQEFDIYGVEMPREQWLITVGDGIMEACSVAYMFKHLPLKDWLSFSEKFGMPGLLGKTDAGQDSPEWDAMKQALQDFATDWAAVCNASASIDLVETKTQGNAPFEPLVERMDQEMTRLWRGGDLGTSSAKDSVGASLQEDETAILEIDDAQWIGETLNRVSEQVLEYTFGEGVECLAYLKLNVPEKKNIDQELKIDEFLLASGAPLALQDTLERYGRPMPDAGDELLQAPAAPVPIPNQDPAASNAEYANEAQAAEALAQAVASDLEPVRQRLDSILRITDPDLREIKLRKFLADLDQMKADILADPSAAQQLQSLLARAFVQGAENKPTLK